MFRQKLAEVTNCSCRLIPNDKNQYMIFKTQNISSKPINKQPKQKYSLKTQTTSSNKHQNKVSSAQKTILKQSKQIQDEKISISGNIDLKKKKPSDKISINSPDHSQVRKIEENLLKYHQNEIQNVEFVKNVSMVKTAQANRNRLEKKAIRNSQTQNLFQKPTDNNIFISNFGNQQSMNSNNICMKSPNLLPKKANCFQEYYKNVPNPYSVGQKNKQNIIQQESVYQILKKETFPMNPKIGNQQNLNKKKKCDRALQQINLNIQPQIFHQSLQKYENAGRYRQSRGTYNGSLKSKNSLNVQNLDDQSARLDFYKCRPVTINNNHLNMPIQNYEMKFQNSFQSSVLQNFNSNKSQIYSNRNLANHRKASVKNDRTNFNTQASMIQDDQIIKQWIKLKNTQNTDKNSQNSNTNTTNAYDSVKDRNSQFIKHQSSAIQNKEQFLIQKKFRTTQNSQIYDLKQKNKLHECSIDQNVQYSQIFSRKNDNTKLFIEKINTFNDIMSTKQECQSFLEGQNQQNQNQQSVVILRYKDLLQNHNQNLVSNSNITCQIQTARQTNQSQMYKLKPSNLQLNTNQKQKNNMTSQSNFLTNVKQYGKKNLFNMSENSSTIFNNNLKKTVKVSKQYLTQNFNE